jgi:hypothetical protein
MRYFPACLILVAAALGTSGALSAQEIDNVTSTRVTVRGTEPHEFDSAKLQARARIVYTSSGPRTQGGRMIDDDLQTVFRFSESDRSPTVIVELARSTKVHRVSAAFKAEGAKLDVYLLDEMPKNPADLQFAKPEASVVDLPDAHGFVSVDVSVGSARYVTLRWTRNRWREPFEVAEISALSNDPADLVFEQEIRLADNGGTFTTSPPPQIPVVSP